MANGVVLVQLRMRKGMYARLRAEAEQAGLSMNRYLIRTMRLAWSKGIGSSRG